MVQPTSSPPVPRVAVIVPAYGVAHLLGEALGSVLAQSVADWECVVVDDGAPDDVANVVAPFLADPRIRFLATDNRGVSVARNRAIETCSAPLICLLDGDDLLRPGYLAAMITIMESDPAARLATCNARLFGAIARERLCFSQSSPCGSLEQVLDRSFGIYIGSMFRRADWASIGGFDPALSHCEDFDLWVRLMQLGGHARYVDAPLCDYRIRASSASADKKRMIAGNLRVYEKALAALPGKAGNRQLIVDLITESHEALAFEDAIDRVVEGDMMRGLGELARLRSLVAGPVWSFSFALWRMVPSLAGPMLRWRRKQHSRGYQPRRLSGLFQRAAA